VAGLGWAWALPRREQGRVIAPGHSNACVVGVVVCCLVMREERTCGRGPNKFSSNKNTDNNDPNQEIKKPGGQPLTDRR
jgi:hypothetical protein